MKTVTFVGDHVRDFSKIIINIYKGNLIKKTNITTKTPTKTTNCENASFDQQLNVNNFYSQTFKIGKKEITLTYFQSGTGDKTELHSSNLLLLNQVKNNFEQENFPDNDVSFSEDDICFPIINRTSISTVKDFTALDSSFEENNNESTITGSNIDTDCIIKG